MEEFAVETTVIYAAIIGLLILLTYAVGDDRDAGLGD
jgi:hypothetical protein